MKISTKVRPLTIAALLIASACGDSQAPTAVEIPVVIDATGLADTQTDLSYSIAITEARYALSDLQFMTGESEHASLTRQAYDLLIPSALAHPGHGGGGTTSGELPGSFIVDWASADGEELGRALLQPGDYTSAFFTLTRQVEHPELSIRLAGTATREGQSTDFSFEIAAPEGREISGIRFDDTISSSTAETDALHFRFALEKVFGEGHLLDGLDFETLGADGELNFDANSEDETYLAVRRRLLSHDHVEFELQEF